MNGNMVAAKFDHATSRNIDPQLHSHVFVVNAVLAQDGSWKANEPRAIFQDQKSLGAPMGSGSTFGHLVVQMGRGRREDVDTDYVWGGE